ncbi:MAG: DUF7010 family protein [Oceanicaulis sp.]
MPIELKSLEAAYREARLASYLRLRGGYPVALAGMVYWAALGVWGYSASLGQWAMAAFWGSGLLFPLAVMLSYVFKRPFIGAPQAAGSLTAPVLISMLLFWPMAFAAGAIEAYELIPLILAIGMGLHWPAIGWSYGRSALYTAHAIIRAGLVLYIFVAFPEHRLTWMPLSVAGVYALSIAGILLDTARLARTRPDLVAAPMSAPRAAAA